MACNSPCNCKNDFTYIPCNAHTPCGESATCLGTAPCAYVIQFKCKYSIFSSILGLDFLEGEVVLWRECLFRDEWTDRSCPEYGAPGSPGFGATIDCLLAFTGQAHPDDDANYDSNCETPHRGGNNAGAASQGCYCDGCTQSPFKKAYAGARWRLNITGLADTNGNSPTPPASFGAYLVYGECNGTNTETPVAVYYSDGPWNCQSENTMIKTGHYDPVEPDIYKYLPQKLCVRPLANNPVHPCGLGNSDICDCEDLGCDKLQQRITFECQETESLDLTFTRYTDGCPSVFGVLGGNDFCDDITFPDVACGVFVAIHNAEVCDAGTEQRQIIFLIWCDGGDWTLRAYCRYYDTTPTYNVELIDEQTLTRVNVCEEEIADVSGYPQYWFDDVTIDASDSDCCAGCGTIDTDCCTDMPDTLYATFTHTGPGACAAVDGQVVELTYVGTDAGGHYWQGTLAVCANYDVIFHQQFAPSYSPPGDCGHYIRVENTGGGTDCIFSGENNTPQCPLVSVSFTMQNWSKANCAGCCTELIGGQFTITVTP